MYFLIVALKKFFFKKLIILTIYVGVPTLVGVVPKITMMVSELALKA